VKLRWVGSRQRTRRRNWRRELRWNRRFLLNRINATLRIRGVLRRRNLLRRFLRLLDRVSQGLIGQVKVVFDAAQACILGRTERDKPRSLIARGRLFRRKFAYSAGFAFSSSLSRIRGPSHHYMILREKFATRERAAVEDRRSASG